MTADRAALDETAGPSSFVAGAAPNGTAGPSSIAAVAMVLDGGPCGCGVESTVLDGLRQPPAVLRPGGVTFEQLRGLEGLEGLQVRACGGEI